MNDTDSTPEAATPPEQNPDQARRLERRAAEAMVAAYLQVARSTQLAHWLQQARERSLERRAERAQDMKQIVDLQYQIDAQQPQAMVLSTAAGHFRAQAKNLARFTKAGLTFEDFERMGVADVIDPEELKLAIEAAAAEPPDAAGDGDGDSPTETPMAAPMPMPMPNPMPNPGPGPGPDAATTPTWPDPLPGAGSGET